MNTISTEQPAFCPLECPGMLDETQPGDRVGPVYMGLIKDEGDISFHFGFVGCNATAKYLFALNGKRFVFAVLEESAVQSSAEPQPYLTFFGLLRDPKAQTPDTEFYVLRTFGQYTTPDELRLQPVTLEQLATGLIQATDAGLLSESAINVLKGTIEHLRPGIFGTDFDVEVTITAKGVGIQADDLALQRRAVLALLANTVSDFSGGDISLLREFVVGLEAADPNLSALVRELAYNAVKLSILGEPVDLVPSVSVY